MRQQTAGSQTNHQQSAGQRGAPTSAQTNPIPPKRPTYRSTSIKQLGGEKDAISPLSIHPNNASSDFSEDDLVNCWIEYANSLTNEKTHLKNTLIHCKPKLKGDFLFEVTVYNPAQKDEISESSTYILGYLFNKLNNTRIRMDVRIAEKDQKEMIYTTAEKYAYLCKKNHYLEKLVKTFDLTIE